MKVIFLESVEGTAEVGEVREVKNGFARNFLLPRGLAGPAVEPYLARAKARALREAKQQEALDQDASAVAERLEGKRVSFTARVGEQGKLYGSITAVHIAQEVAQLIGAEEFDHRKVLLPEAIKEVGIQPIRVRLTRNVEATIEVEVLAEDAEEEEEEQAEDAEAAADDAEASSEEEPAAEVEAPEDVEAAAGDAEDSGEEEPAAEVEAPEDVEEAPEESESDDDELKDQDESESEEHEEES